MSVGFAMADVTVVRKRAASPPDPPAPAAKKARQVSTTRDSDTGSNYSQAPSQDGSIGDQTTTSDTPLTPYSINPNRSRRNCYHCPYENCDRAFNRPCRLEEHIRSHTNERPFVCSYPDCTKTFIRQTHLNRHVKDEHTNQRDHECTWPGCGKKFGTATRLRRHREAHENKFHCTDYPPCREVFRKHSTLQKHILATHLGKKAYQCTKIDDDTGKQCTQAYDTASGLRSHEARVHGGVRYFCSQCGPGAETPGTDIDPPGFSTYAALQTHIKTAHPPICEHCGLTCSTHKQLQAHVDLAHSGVPLEARRTFICPYVDCGRGFTKQGNLNVHIRATHENVRNFVCGKADLTGSKKDFIKAWTGEGACGRAFSTKANLEEHIRTQHIGLEGTRKAKLKETGQEGDETTKTARRRPRSHAVSTIARLTGAGYAEESGRPIACIYAPTCEHRFHREYDLEFHLGSAHGMSAREVVEALTERRAFEGGRFWIGGAEEMLGEDMGDGNTGDNADWDDEDWETQRELDRRAGIKNTGPTVDVHTMDLGGGMAIDPALTGSGENEPKQKQGQDGEIYDAVWSYLNEKKVGSMA